MKVRNIIIFLSFMIQRYILVPLSSQCTMLLLLLLLLCRMGTLVHLTLITDINVCYSPPWQLIADCSESKAKLVVAQWCSQHMFLLVAAELLRCCGKQKKTH